MLSETSVIPRYPRERTTLSSPNRGPSLALFGCTRGMSCSSVKLEAHALPFVLASASGVHSYRKAQAAPRVSVVHTRYGHLYCDRTLHKDRKGGDLSKLTRAQYLDEVTCGPPRAGWGCRSSASQSFFTRPSQTEQVVNELACGGGGRVHGAKCLATLAGVA